MDTDDLSNETYDGVIIESEKLTRNLTLHYGCLADDCDTEAEYLKEAKRLTQEIMEYDDVDLDDLFFGEPPEKEKLILTLNKILINIEEIKKIPVEKRHYEF